MGRAELQGMAGELVGATMAEGPNTATGKLQLWSAVTPAKIRIAGITLDVEDGLMVVGLRVASGGGLSTHAGSNGHGVLSTNP